MKSIVIYFSQTGNTRKIARAIHKGMSRRLEQCNIYSLKEINPQDLDKYDLIGLGSPVWAAEPRNVRRFINSIPYSQGKHVFSFNTHAEMPAMYFPIVTRRLKSRGLTVIGMRDWYGASNVQCFPHPSLTHGHPDEIDLEEAENFGREMVEVSQRISAGETQLIPPLPEIPKERIWKKGHKIPLDRSPHGTIKYNKEKCLYPKCRLCVDNCPMNYIDLDALPLFGSRPRESKCEEPCTFCELICPTGAIYGEDWDFGLKVCLQNRADFEKLLAEAESAGRFRRLVPLEMVGWDTPYYKVFNKRPRLKLTDDK